MNNIPVEFMIRGKRTNYIVYIVIVSSLILSGCVSQPRSTTPEPTLVPTVVPTVAVTPAPGTPISIGSPAEIKITSIPKRAVEKADFAVKWEVSGGTTGNIDKTEILWDFKKGNASTTDYSHNTTSMTGKTPFEFTEKLNLPRSSTIYIRAYAIVDGTELFSDEYQITIFPEYTTY